MDMFRIADPLGLDADLTTAEREVRDAAAAWVDATLLPHVAGWFEAGTVPREVAASMGAAGLLGGALPAPWGRGWSPVSYGLAMAELERADSGLRSLASVQGALVMWPIATYGSAEQQQRWLPRLAQGEAVGCFGLTEPESGSDPGSMRTVAQRDGDDWVLHGTKRWLTNGPMADVALVWARVEGDGEGAETGPASIRGFLVELPSAGARMESIPGRMSLRASLSGQLQLDGVRVPAGAMLPGVRGLKGPLSCLNQARYGIAFGVTGAHAACLQSARDYTLARSQFGRPLASRQLVQARLAELYASLGQAQLLAMRLGRLKEAGKLTPVQVSLGKRNNVASALEAARTARELLGGNGILLEHAPVRHLLNLETVRTYEGTHDVHTLVLGRHVTGLDAFS